jgi:hypothetical protein
LRLPANSADGDGEYHNVDVLTIRFDRPAHSFLSLFPTAQRHRQADDGGDAAANEQPDSLSFRHRIRLRSSDPLGVHKQQHDPTNERERSDGGWDKVADCGLKVHSEELDRLSRSREGDARVSEHHDA